LVNSVKYEFFTEAAINRKDQCGDDENLLHILKADYDFFTIENTSEMPDELYEEDRKELISLLNEPFGYETESHKAFKKTTAKWRTKL
jgi:hypothetical protein